MVEYSTHLFAIATGQFEAGGELQGSDPLAFPSVHVIRRSLEGEEILASGNTRPEFLGSLDWPFIPFINYLVL